MKRQEDFYDVSTNKRYFKVFFEWNYLLTVDDNLFLNCKSI